MELERRYCAIYHSYGMDRVDILGTTLPLPKQLRANPSTIPVGQAVRRDLVCVRHDAAVSTALDLSIHHQRIPVVDGLRRPIGMVTRRELLGGAFTQQTVAALMDPVVAVLDEHATLAEAIRRMTSDDLHELLIVGNDGELVGVLASSDIADWLAGDLW